MCRTLINGLSLVLVVWLVTVVVERFLNIHSAVCIQIQNQTRPFFFFQCKFFIDHDGSFKKAQKREEDRQETETRGYQDINAYMYLLIFILILTYRAMNMKLIKTETFVSR
jgi:hypothetical protein